MLTLNEDKTNEFMAQINALRKAAFHQGVLISESRAELAPAAPKPQEP